MTLIIGIKLPKGVLLVSDTREVNEKTEEIVSEAKRKVTLVTPCIFLAGAGLETNFYVAKILKTSLYNSDLPTLKTREKILELYRTVNDLYSENHPDGYPIGDILIAEYDKDHKEFNLLRGDGLERFINFSILTQVRDVAIIGSNARIRETVKRSLELNLNNLTNDLLNDFEFIAKLCHEFIKQLNDKTIGKDVYCTYLTLLDNKPASSIFLIDTTNQLHQVNQADDGENINLTEK